MFTYLSFCPESPPNAKLVNVTECVFQGNAYFKEGKYESAVECYSRGMDADGMNVLLPANRAMAFLKLEK